VKTSIELLYAEGSNCAQRVRWALNYKSVPYSVLDYASLSKDRLYRVSPLGKVPALLVDGQAFAESVAMLEYIEELQSMPPLLPVDLFQRAKAREVLEIINGWINPIQCSSVPRFFIPELNDAEVKSYRLQWFIKTLPVLHDSLLFKDSKFAVGTDFTWADLALIPIYTKALVLGLESTCFPKFAQHVVHCMSFPVIEGACPEDLRNEISKRKLL
jgi:glutathione S-transferase